MASSVSLSTDQEQDEEIDRPKLSRGCLASPAELRPILRAQKPGHRIAPVGEELRLHRFATRDPKDALVDEVEKVFGAIDQLVLARIEVDELLEVGLVVVEERVHVPALSFEELPKELLDLSAGLRRDGLVDRRHHLADQSIDVSQRLALLPKLDLLELYVADLLLTHTNETLVHPDVGCVCAMLPKQGTNRIRETDSLDAGGEPKELGLDFRNLGFGPRELLADVFDLPVEPAIPGPNGSQCFVSPVELFERLLEPLR